jgi:hypothetical protein
MALSRHDNEVRMSCSLSKIRVVKELPLCRSTKSYRKARFGVLLNLPDLAAKNLGYRIFMKIRIKNVLIKVYLCHNLMRKILKHSKIMTRVK